MAEPFMRSLRLLKYARIRLPIVEVRTKRHYELEVVKIDNSFAHNTANYEKLKFDLKTIESANSVIESLRNTGKLPKNYINKKQAIQQGWSPGKALSNSIANSQIGGDIFHNTTNILPTAPNRIWYEADIGLSNTISRSNQKGTRLLYSNDGLLYITVDHYKTITEIGRWK